MNRMTFSADKRRLTEGEVVALQWQCSGAQQVNLTIDNGYRTSTMPLACEGTKKLRLNRSKGRTKMRLSVTIDGHEYHKTLRIAVRPMPITRAEWVDDRGRKTSFGSHLLMLFSKWRGRYLRNLRTSQLREFWQHLSERQRLVLVALMTLFVATLLPITPLIGITLIVLGLLWLLRKG